jgi:hypothetical protein
MRTTAATTPTAAPTAAPALDPEEEDDEVGCVTFTLEVVVLFAIVDADVAAVVVAI